MFYFALSPIYFIIFIYLESKTGVFNDSRKSNSSYAIALGYGERSFNESHQPLFNCCLTDFISFSYL